MGIVICMVMIMMVMVMMLACVICSFVGLIAECGSITTKAGSSTTGRFTSLESIADVPRMMVTDEIRDTQRSCKKLCLWDPRP